MLQLFQSIFGAGHEAATPYSAGLIERAIERAVDGTDPRLRALAGYRKKLRAAVIHAIDHVIALVDSLPAPLVLDRARYTTDPELSAYFASVEQLHEVLACEPVLNQWLKSADGAGDGPIVMLLLMEQHERQVFGVALEGETLRRDVAQTTVSFARHRLVDPAGSEDETRRLLKRRAFDHLLTLALGRLATAHTERAELQHERELLRRKYAALAAGNWGFEAATSDPHADPATVQRQIDEIESQLGERGAGAGLLAAQLNIVVDVLQRAEQHLWSVRAPLAVDRLGVKQATAGAAAPEIILTALHNAAGQRLVARLVTVARTALPAPRDPLREAQRALG